MEISTPKITTIGELVNNPFSPNFRPPKATTAKELTNYVVARQLASFGRGFDIPYKVMLKQVNVLLKRYGVDLTQRGLVLALSVAEYPFSCKFVEERIAELQKNQPYNYQTGK